MQSTLKDTTVKDVSNDKLATSVSYYQLAARAVQTHGH
jgi:hypothetical protein